MDDPVTDDLMSVCSILGRRIGHGVIFNHFFSLIRKNLPLHFLCLHLLNSNSPTRPSSPKER